MLDLDNFKKINDSFGHQAGDIALQLAAKAVKSACRQNDILGRIGGEEFGILLDGCNSQEGYAIAESCRKAIEAAGSSSKLNDEISLTASFGVADNTTTQQSLDKLMANADKALYKAKDEGRNRVAMFGGSD
jgi:diguanylate cyclase (GGDEF)-like protein